LWLFICYKLIIPCKTWCGQGKNDGLWIDFNRTHRWGAEYREKAKDKKLCDGVFIGHLFFYAEYIKEDLRYGLLLVGNMCKTKGEGVMVVIVWMIVVGILYLPLDVLYRFVRSYCVGKRG